MDTYVLPVEGLTVTDDWQVGPVTLLTATSRAELLAPFTQSTEPWAQFPMVTDAIDHLIAATAAAVVAHDLDHAIDLVRDSLALVRVFHDRTRLMKGTPTFGLPGEVFQRRLGYAQIGSGGGEYRAGFANRGDAVGYTLTGTARADWLAAADLNFAASAIGAEPVSAGAGRALRACRLLSHAILEHDVDAKLRTLVTALEVLVGGDPATELRQCDDDRPDAADDVPSTKKPTTGKYQLARRVVFLTCGAIAPNETLCGRGRPTCPYLSLDPHNRKERQKIDDLQERASMDVAWRCSEWSQIVEWYDSRNGAVHDGSSGLTSEEVAKVQYWITRYITPLALTWLAEHVDAPIHALDTAISELPVPPDWEAIIAGVTEA